MKNSFLLLVLLLLATQSTAQNFGSLSRYEFEAAEDYQKNEPKVVECVDFLFKTPADRATESRLIAVQYILKWMEGTPEFSFAIDEKSIELTKDHQELFGLYLAALSKLAIENEGEPYSDLQLHLKAQDMLVDYCSDKSNNIKPSKAIKKLLKKK